MKTIRSILALALLAHIGGGTSPALAQQAGDTPAAPAYRAALSISPLGAVFGVYNAEYERAVGERTTLGLSGTLWRHSEDYADDVSSGDAAVTYFSTDVKVRYYPDAALDGFSFGALVGATRLAGDVTACDLESGCDDDSGSVLAFSSGVEVDYTWILGPSRRVFVASGLGAKRLFPVDDVDATVAYPFLRLTVGLGM